MKLGTNRNAETAAQAVKPLKEKEKRARRATPTHLEELKRLQMNIPMSLHKELKDFCYQRDLEMTFVIENLVEDLLKDQEPYKWLNQK